MPWKVTDVMEERIKFITEVLKGQDTMSQLCRRFGISRKTGYKWLGRYRRHKVLGLKDRSRAPHHRPRSMRPHVEEAVLALRRAHATWGAAKLRAVLVRKQPRRTWPAVSTIGSLLLRSGLTLRRKRRHHATASAAPLSACSGANEVWCADFKGWFRTGDGERCEPFTLTDAHSRFALRCVGLPKSGSTAVVKALFEAAFREFGLPEVVRTDNGPPFASTGLGGLSRLSVWLMRLGLRPERIRPGKPQDNGRHERFHRTLKAETAKPPKANLRAQQRAFDRFVEEFNYKRPHQALGQTTPASHYHPSPRPLPARLAPLPAYPDDWQTRAIRADGRMKWGGREISVTAALAGQRIGLEPLGNQCWRVHFLDLALGIFDERKRGVIPVKKNKTKNSASPI